MRHKGIFITATDTNVGKTYVAAGLAAAIARKWNRQTIQSSFQTEVQTQASGLVKEAFCGGPKVQLWKPVQSGVKLGSREADSYRLMKGSGLPQTETETATLTFAEAAAPWIAAKYAGVELDYTQLTAEGWQRQQTADYVIVEGAGGLMVPLTENRLMADFAYELRLPLLIIARPSLGTVNHTLMTVKAAQSYGIQVVGVILNGCKEEHESAVRENAMMIEQFSGVSVLGILPWFGSEPLAPAGQSDEDAAWSEWREQWADVIEERVELDRLLAGNKK